MDNMKEKLIEIIGKCSANLESICEGLIDFLDGQEKDMGISYLREFLSGVEAKDMPISKISDMDEFLAMDIPQERIDSILELEQLVVSNMVKKRVREDDFYLELWNKLMDDSLMGNKESRAIFLQFLWRDSRIPYFELGEGEVLGNEKYLQVIDKIKPAIRKGQFIMNANLEYKTQRASLLLEVAGKLEDDTERTVFWADLVSRQKRMTQILQEQQAAQVELLKELKEKVESLRSKTEE